MAFLFSVLFVSAISFNGSVAQAILTVEFPGPVPVNVVGDGLCMAVVPSGTDDRQDVVVGTEDGFLAIAHYVANETAFSLLGRMYLGGELVGLVPWEGYDGPGQGLILTSREPDLAYFIGVQPTPPYFDFRQTISLPEDPGGVAFGGGPGGADLELGITLPGVDQLLILASDGGPWSIKQTLATGDNPADLVGIDTDGDLVRELVTADDGALSQSFTIFGRGENLDWDLLRHQTVAGSPRRIQAWDLDMDGKQELVVGFSDTSKVVFLDVQEDQFSFLGSVPLVSVAMEFHLERDEFGQTNLLVANEHRGLIEFFQGQSFPFSNIDSYYPGCLPKQLTLCDFNGDGRGDLAALGTTNQAVTVMFRRQDVGFWGYPALPLAVAPNGGELADFNGDGFKDLVASGLNEKVLLFFAGNADGSFDPIAEAQEFPNFFFPPVAVQVDDDAAMELASIDPILGMIRVLDFVPGTGFEIIHEMFLGGAGIGLMAADCDGDGLDDLVGISPFERTVKIFYGLADGMFSDPVSVVFQGQVKGVEVLDLTGDGLLDLVVADGLSRAWTATNLGDRSYLPYFWVNASSGALHIALGDFDGDLDQDIVIGNTTDQSLSYLENLGDGSLSRRVGSHLLPGKPLGVECVDLNLDGMLDVVVNLGEIGQVGIVLGMGDWQFSYPLTISAGVNVAQLIVDDFNDDLVPDILALDSFLNLGLTLLNVDRVLVAVHPSVLTAQCSSQGLNIDVALPPAESWSLEIGRPGWSQIIARDGQSVRGSILFERERWRLNLSSEDLQDLEDLAGPLGALSLRLVVGNGAGAEELVTPLAGMCSSGGQKLPSLAPSWSQAPYPNPFNPSVQAEFTLARAGQVHVTILDARGALVATLLDGAQGAGTHALHWDGTTGGTSAGAGLYFLRISTEYGILSQKIMLLK